MMLFALSAASVRICLALAIALQPSAVVRVVVTASGRPIANAQVVAGGVTTLTAADGTVVLRVPAGAVTITIVKKGFNPASVETLASGESEQSLSIALEPQPAIEEEVTVSATRINKRLDDQPMRVEVLGAEEIDEKRLMTPGDIVMMLNEMGGMRVQATSPSLGAASVRVQGMRGRYTRFLADGLPLYGEVGGLGLLQIPPSDLGQVEVIKGVASALYGAGALGGVVDLISRRPADTPMRELLVNGTTRGGTDAVLFAAQPHSPTLGSSLLIGVHGQRKTDVDDDGWADIASYSRAVARPRLFWNDDAGRSLFVTGGLTWENRAGGTMPDRIVPSIGTRFIEALDTLRFDGGVVGQTPILGRYVLTGRFASARNRGDHQIGDTVDRLVRSTTFAELALRGSAPRQTFVAGAAFERSTMTSRVRPDFAYAYNVPAVFVQDDVEAASWLVLSGSARVDAHHVFGTFVSPRVSALARRPGWNARASLGTGFFAPSALTEETEAAGLFRLRLDGPLRAERGRSASFDVTRQSGPLAITATLFRYDVDDPVVVDRPTYTLGNVAEPTAIAGYEAVATFRREPFSVTATYTYVRSHEGAGDDRAEVPLTPRHSAGAVAMWEREGRGRAGIEAYFTGRQRLEDNPFRRESAPYLLFGGLIERHVGRLRLFVNVENLADVRQTNWDPLVRPSRAVDGRWTVDAWAPLDGRVLNGGVRLSF